MEEITVSPLGIAAGLIKSRLHLPHKSLGLLNHVTFGSFTRNPKVGNPEPTYWYNEETRSSINAVGLTNPGLDHFVGNDLTSIFMMMGHHGAIRVSLAPLEAGDVRSMLFLHGDLLHSLVDEVEINAACPNHRGGDGSLHPVLCWDPHALEALMSETTNYPGAKAIKIAPDMSKEALEAVVELAITYDFSSIVSGNTLKGDATIGDVKRLSVDQGGMAGAILLDPGLEQVRTLHRISDDACVHSKRHIRLIGCGGVMSAADVAAYITAGADITQCATYFSEYGENGIRDLICELASME